MRKIITRILLSVPAIVLIFYMAGNSSLASDRDSQTITVTDGAGRKVTVPKCPEHVICSGPGCLRFLTYLKLQNKIVAADDMEKRESDLKTRPYAIANPQFKDYPIFGEFRGNDNPELIVSLNPMPQVIFKTFANSGHDPVELQNKTGIPVIVLNHGDFSNYREDMYQSLRIIAKVMCKETRAENVISFFNRIIQDLDKRTADIDNADRKSCYVGGIGFKGPLGLRSTEPTYPPFMLTHSGNVAYDSGKRLSELSHANVAKEKIIKWDPDILFVDLASLISAPEASAVNELKHDPAYQQLTAVKSGQVYGVLPYNWYAQNFGSILADAYYVGTILYPERFRDISPGDKADEIYTFLLGTPVFDEMNKTFQGKVFTRLSL
ncbi:iron ABC transporter substrate-binding protein [Desulfonema magnum]|uniref:ABC transporter, substrate-binding protein n=1 Tax=Desulfonema magnum TaxID=45655 RepID=A0A975GTX8_9BACT|nr:iron ABC transporter substrate-binding protein [Desulfonema magnum]QTA92593.1 putative ABC transporter, substrate-binding protein [Desulfonema magnum]